MNIHINSHYKTIKKYDLLKNLRQNEEVPWSQTYSINKICSKRDFLIIFYAIGSEKNSRFNSRYFKFKFKDLIRFIQSDPFLESLNFLTILQTFRHEKKACFVFVSCPHTQTRTLTLNTRNFRDLDTKHEHEKHEIFVSKKLKFLFFSVFWYKKAINFIVIFFNQ
jgi:hypothetical protein